MIFLTAAGLLFSVQYLFSKCYQLHADNAFKPAIWQVVLESLWLLLLFFPANGFQLHWSAVSLLYAGLYAVCMILCSLASFHAMRLGKVAVVTLFSLSGGLLFPVAYGVLFLDEGMTLKKGLGTALILLSFFGGLYGTNDSSARRPPARFWLLCLAIFVSNGLLSVVTKAHSIHGGTVPEKDFLMLAALFRLAAAFIVLVFLHVQRPEPWMNGIAREGGKRGVWLQILAIGGYAVCNSIANVCSLVTAKTMDSSLQFPLLSAMVVVLTALAARIVYKEKLNRGDMAGLVLTVAGMGLMIL